MMTRCVVSVEGGEPVVLRAAGILDVRALLLRRGGPRLDDPRPHRCCWYDVAASCRRDFLVPQLEQPELSRRLLQ